jgi:hypothetical protein
MKPSPLRATSTSGDTRQTQAVIAARAQGNELTTRRNVPPRAGVAKGSARKAAEAPPQVPPPLPPEEPDEVEESHDRIVARPDGFYWQALDGQQEIGPFDTPAEARADMDSEDEPSWVPGETLAEAEHEIGISDWIDPDTGEPAEGQAPPHLERE